MMDSVVDADALDSHINERLVPIGDIDSPTEFVIQTLGLLQQTLGQQHGFPMLNGVELVGFCLVHRLMSSTTHLSPPAQQ